MDEAFDAYYARGAERDRLGGGNLELVRTLELLEPELPPAPADVLDVGGGPGVYAAHLARAGYRVRLVDAVPLHVEQARELAAAQPEAPFTVELGDARELAAGDESVDAVLLLGPLYHLVDQAERVCALAEARRVVRPGGLVAAAAISRLASLYSGLENGFLADERFAAIVERDLRDGIHLNPTEEPTWFTTSFFHSPGLLAAEVASAGLDLHRIAGVEGPGDWFPGIERDVALRVARLAEEEAALSAHMLALARRDVD